MNKDHILSEDTCILLLEMSLSAKISNFTLLFNNMSILAFFLVFRIRDYLPWIASGIFLNLVVLFT